MLATSHARLLILALLIASASGCSTILTSSRPPLRVNSTPDSAILLSPRGDTIGNTRQNARIQAARAQTLQVTASGFDTAVVRVGRRLKSTTFLNLINPLGWLIDFSTGAAWTHNPNILYASLDSVPVVPEDLTIDTVALGDALTAETLLVLAELADTVGCDQSVGMKWRSERDLYLGVDGRAAALDSDLAELVRSRVALAAIELRRICSQSNPALDSLRALRHSSSSIIPEPTGDSSSQSNAQLTSPVYFGFDSATITSSSVRERLRRLAAAMSPLNPVFVILIEGATDPSGGDEYNFHLGCRRAQAVAAELRNAGTPISRLRLRSLGERAEWLAIPGARGKAPGAELNRRVIFALDVDMNTSAAQETLSCEDRL